MQFIYLKHLKQEVILHWRSLQPSLCHLVWPVLWYINLLSQSKTENKVKGTVELSGPSSPSLSQLPWHKVTRSIPPSGWDVSSLQGYPTTLSPLSAFHQAFLTIQLTYLYSWVARDTMNVKCFAQEPNTMTWPGIEPRPLQPEFCVLIIQPPYY